jgi:Sigma-70, region 4
MAGRNGPSDTPGGQHAPDRLLVSAAVAQLPAEHRAVLRRSFYKHWTTAQIADDLRIPEGTVKARLHTALQALRRTLQEMVADATTQPQSLAALQGGVAGAFGTALPHQWGANLTCGPGAA